MNRIKMSIGRWTSLMIVILLAWNTALTVALVRRNAAPVSASPPRPGSLVDLGRLWRFEPLSFNNGGPTNDVLMWGYNIGARGDRQDHAYPQFRQSFEQHYEDAEGYAFTEWNLDFSSANGGTRRRPAAVAVQLPSFHAGLTNVHLNTANWVSLSFAADDEEFRNADRTRQRLVISDAGIGVGASPGTGGAETKVMAYRDRDANAMFELRTGLPGEKVWQWRYGTALGAPPGSVAFYDSTDHVVGPVVLSDGAVETGATDRFRYRQPLLRVSQRARQVVLPDIETIVRFSGSTRSLAAPAAGNYAVVGGVASADGHPMVAQIRIDGTIVATGKGTVFGVYRLAPGETVTLDTRQTSTAIRETSGDDQTFLSLVYVGE
ncbi:MAG TPA: hypothetical protein VKW09_04575 [bacterium]|nr:hypothetical protein [bacterium]